MNVKIISTSLSVLLSCCTFAKKTELDEFLMENYQTVSYRIVTEVVSSERKKFYKIFLGEYIDSNYVFLEKNSESIGLLKQSDVPRVILNNNFPDYSSEILGEFFFQFEFGHYFSFEEKSMAYESCSNFNEIDGEIASADIQIVGSYSDNVLLYSFTVSEQGKFERTVLYLHCDL
jgi:hypothetical protein